MRRIVPDGHYAGYEKRKTIEEKRDSQLEETTENNW